MGLLMPRANAETTPRRAASPLSRVARIVVACALLTTACTDSGDVATGTLGSTPGSGSETATATTSATVSPTDAATATATTAAPEAATVPEAAHIELGAAAGRRVGQTPIDALRTVEAVAGRQVDVLRTYAFWDSEFPNLRQRLASDEGRSLHLSVNARREDGTVVPWSEIADAQPGTELHDELIAWIERIAAFDGELRVTFHHEADIEPEFGTPDEFVAAWQRFSDLLDDAAPDVPLAWIITLFTMNQPDRAEQFWPGDDHVDWIAADAFNWFGCRGSAEDWRPPELLLEPLIRFGAAHPGKPLMFAEIGSDEDPDDPGRKAAWLDELARLLDQDRYDPIKTIVFFHNDHDDQSSCDWWVDSSPAAAAAFERFGALELFGASTALPATPQCPIVATALGRADDRAVVDGDGDGRYDFVFGLENRFVGVSDQANDGSDHRVVFHFDSLDDLTEGATIELRVRVGERQPALADPVQLVVIDGIPPSDRDAFTEPGEVIDPAWFDATTLGGHHVIDVTGRIDTSTPTTFRLQPQAIPPKGDGKAPLFVGMADASREIDRPALVVRACN